MRYDSILTVTDHDVSKATLFFPCNQTIGAQGIATIFANHVFPYFGIPYKVISDRDMHFTAQFTQELCHLLDITQNISTAYHPQIDGQSKCTNQWLEQYLWVYYNFQQNDWSSLLPMAQYVHNSWKSTTTGFTPFKLLIGFTLEICPVSTITSTLPSLEQKGEFLTQLRNHAQDTIWVAQQMVLKQRNRTTGYQPFTPFQVGDKV